MDDDRTRIDGIKPPASGARRTYPGRGRKASPKRIAQRDRMRQVLDMRRAGATLQVIADKLGYANPSGPKKVIEIALKEVLKEPTEEIRKIEFERLEAMTLVLWPRVFRRDGNPPDMASINAMLRVMERRAGLLGLDAPKKVSLQGEDGAPPVRIAHGMDLARLSTDQLRQLDDLLAAASPTAKAAAQTVDLPPLPPTE